VDMFDCVVPTRNARWACFFVPGGRLNLRNTRFRHDFKPVQPGCGCYVCSNHSRAYIRHLFVTKEWLAPILATLHNLHYFAGLMAEMREHITNGSFQKWRDGWHLNRQSFNSDGY